MQSTPPSRSAAISACRSSSPASGGFIFRLLSRLRTASSFEWSVVDAYRKVLDTPGAREQEVESGRADVFMTDYPFNQRMLKTTDWARLISPEKPYHITPYAWAVKPGEGRWLDRVNQFLTQSKSNGQLLKAAQHHDLSPIVRLD